jgi:hypothetical protein
MDKESMGKKGAEKKRREKWKIKKGKKKKKQKGQFRHFTTSMIKQVKLFCQTFSKTTSAPSKKSLHRGSQS